MKIPNLDGVFDKVKATVEEAKEKAQAAAQRTLDEQVFESLKRNLSAETVTEILKGEDYGRTNTFVRIKFGEKEVLKLYIK